MTTTAIAWTVAAVLWAAVLAVAGTATLNRLTRRRRHREPETPERPQPRAAAVAARPPVLLRLVRLLVLHRRPAPGRRLPTPAPHEGASVNWSPTRETSRAGQAPELITATEHMAADHAFLSGISAAVNEFDRLIEAELDRFLRDLPQVRMRLAAGATPTGEWSLVELRDRLAAEDLAEVPA